MNVTLIFLFPFLNCLCRFCPLCHSCVSRQPPRQPSWQFPCWSSWLLSSCCLLTPPNSMRGLKASSGLLWWDQIFKLKKKKKQNTVVHINMLKKLSSSAKKKKTVKYSLTFPLLMVFFFLSKDFLRCVTASIIFFIISIIAVSRYLDGSSKAAGVKLTPSWFIYY